MKTHNVLKTKLNECVSVCVQQIESDCKIQSNDKARNDCTNQIKQWQEHQMPMTCEDSGKVLARAFTCSNYTKEIKPPVCRPRKGEACG